MSFTRENFMWYLKTTWGFRKVKEKTSENNIYPLGCAISTRHAQRNIDHGGIKDFIMSISAGHWGTNDWWGYKPMSSNGIGNFAHVRDQIKNTRLILVNTASYQRAHRDHTLYDILGNPTTVVFKNGCHDDTENKLWIIKDHDVDWKACYDLCYDSDHFDKQKMPFDLSDWDTREEEYYDQEDEEHA